MGLARLVPVGGTNRERNDDVSAVLLLARFHHRDGNAGNRHLHAALGMGVRQLAGCDDVKHAVGQGAAFDAGRSDISDDPQGS